jgi:hypothetical protein
MCLYVIIVWYVKCVCGRDNCFSFPVRSRACCGHRDVLYVYMHVQEGCTYAFLRLDVAACSTQKPLESASKSTSDAACHSSHVCACVCTYCVVRVCVSFTRASPRWRCDMYEAGTNGLFSSCNLHSVLCCILLYLILARILHSLVHGCTLVFVVLYTHSYASRPSTRTHTQTWVYA